MDDARELEGIAGAAIEAGGQDPTKPIALFRLVRSLLSGGLHKVPRLVGCRAAFAVIEGGERIIYTSGATLHNIAHELGHVLLRRAGYRGDREEQNANYLGGAILLPRRAVISMAGLPLPELAAVFMTSETCAALREAEVRDLPRAIVAPKHVHVRGPEEWIWPPETTLRSWARKPRPGLRKTRMKDAPERVVLDAEAV